MRKAVELLGLGTASVREIETDSDFAMRPAHLASVLKEDQARGELPVAVVASAGTVNTGAIDPLAEISAVCAEAEADGGRVWLHVDGAYGGPAVLLSDRYDAAAAAIGRADSIAIDPHKWLYVPVDAGVILLAEPGLARETFSLVPDYLRTGEESEPWFSEYGVEQTRPFRALKIWMAMRQLGLAGYRELIGHDLELAGYLRAEVEAAPDLELLADGLSVVCFRYRPAEAGGPEGGRPRGGRARGGRARPQQPQPQPGPGRAARRPGLPGRHRRPRPAGAASLHRQPGRNAGAHRRPAGRDPRARRPSSS